MSEDSLSKELLSRNIRRLRRLNKMSQLELSQRADLSIAFINAIENQEKWISAKTLDKITAALNAKPHELFLPLDNSAKNLHLAEDHRKLLGELRDIVAEYDKK